MAPTDELAAAPRAGLGRTLGELGAGGAYACLLSLAIQFAVTRLPVSDPGTFVPEALLASGIAVLFLLVYTVPRTAWARRWPLWGKLLGAWTAVVTLATVVLALPLHATRFFLGGASVDNTFRLQYLERMASTMALQDMNYVDIPPYYPAGWFWLGGRFANLAGIPGWEAYKPYAITWCALAAVVTFVLFSLVLRRRIAFLATLVTVLAGFSTAGVEEPYAWPTTAWLPPIAMLAWALLRRRGRSPWWALVLVGAYLGICALTYTLHLGFGALLVVILAVLATVFAIREGASAWTAVRRVCVRVAVIAVVAAVLAAVVWVPFFVAGGLGRANPALRFLPESSAFLPTPFTVPSVFGLLCLLGLVWVGVAAVSGKVANSGEIAAFGGIEDSGVMAKASAAFPLSVLVGFGYAWFGFSTLTLVLETTLLPFRLVPMIGLTLAVAGLLAAVAGLRRLAARPAWRRSPHTAIRLVTVLAVAASVVLVQDSVRDDLSEAISDAESDYYPTGRTPVGKRDPADEAAWTPHLIRTLDTMTGAAPTETVLLTDQHHLLMFRPYWNFQQLTPHYANPLARYGRRSAEIRSWAAADDPATLRKRMHDGPFRPPTVFVLERTRSGDLRYTVTADAFPRSEPVAGAPVVFDEALFSAPHFERRDVGPFTVLAVRP